MYHRQCGACLLSMATPTLVSFNTLFSDASLMLTKCIQVSPVRPTASGSSSSWGASAMAARGKQQYPLPIQSTLHLSSSKGIGKPFRPPKRAGLRLTLYLILVLCVCSIT